jgi:hypothetical protein
VVEILSIDGSMVNGLLHGGAIVRMSALDYEFYGWSSGPIALEDSKGFL